MITVIGYEKLWCRTQAGKVWSRVAAPFKMMMMRIQAGPGGLQSAPSALGAACLAVCLLSSSLSRNDGSCHTIRGSVVWIKPGGLT